MPGTHLSTHVLDTARGEPAARVTVTLLVKTPEPEGSWLELARGETDADGRLGAFPELSPGRHRLIFATSSDFFPEVVITFEVLAGRERLHVPLLLSPYGYTVYRGS